MLSAGSFNQAVMWQQFQSSNPLPPGNPLVFELLMISPSPPPAPPPPPPQGQSYIQMSYSSARFDSQIPLPQEQTSKSEN